MGQTGAYATDHRQYVRDLKQFLYNINGILMKLYKLKSTIKFGAGQIVVQLVNFLIGIIVIREMNKNQYAYFSIVNSMQGAMNMIADSGISIGLSAIGGAFWSDRKRFSQLLKSAMHLRSYFVVISAALVTPIMAWMLLRNGCSPGYTGVLAVFVLLGLSAQLTTGVLEIVPRLHSQIANLQKLEFIGVFVRAVLILLIFSLVHNAAIAVLCASIAFLAKNFALRRWTAPYIDENAGVIVEDKKSLLVFVKRQMPNSIFFCIQGQITIFLISLFGSATNVADVGALARLAVMFAVISSIMANIVAPTFSRCSDSHKLKRNYIAVLGAYTAFASVLLLAAWVFPDPMLWILGNKYAYLKSALILIIISAVLNGYLTVIWSINASKGWTDFAWLYIPFTLITQAALLAFLNVSTVRGVILFGIYSLLPNLCLNFWLSIRGLAASGTQQPLPLVAERE